MPTIQTDKLKTLCTGIFTAAGATPETAQRVVESLLKSNLIGHDSHGVQLIPGYIDRIQAGDMDPNAQPTIERQTSALAVVNGNWGFGQVTARFGTELAADLARSAGVACVALTRSNHIGRLGEYAHMLADAGLIGNLMTGISGHMGVVAPFGGRERIFGTNPIAWGIPVDAARPPLILDYATSGVAYGKVAVAQSKGQPIAPGLLVDKAGNPTTTPDDLIDGGALLPFGGHKGGGLNLLVELLTVGLAGFADHPPESNQVGNPTLIVAYNVDSFLPKADFDAYTESLLQRIKDSQTAAGFDEILLPGEPEAKTLAQRSEEGIPIPDPTWQSLLELAQELGVS